MRMMLRRSLSLGMGLILAGHAYPAPATALAAPAVPAQREAQALDRKPAAMFTLGQLSAFIDRLDSQDSAAVRAEIKHLQGLGTPDAADRLKLAWLLSRNNAPAADLARAEEQLEGLERLFDDAATRHFVRLLQRTLAAERSLRQERKKTAELYEKLQQIKKLELELQERSQAGPQQGK